MGSLKSNDCLVLGVDCSTKYTAIGCVRCDRVIGEISLDLGRYQSSLLPGLVDELLGFWGFKLTDVDVLAVTIGPGYFTGLRVGLSYVTTLAYALEVPVVPLPSLKVLAGDFIETKNVITLPVIWARGNQYYSCIFESEGEDLKETAAPDVLDERDIIARAKDMSLEKGEAVFVIGDDVARFQEKPSGIHFLTNGVRGGNVAKLGFKMRSCARSPMQIEALYLRRPY